MLRLHLADETRTADCEKEPNVEVRRNLATYQEKAGEAPKSASMAGERCLPCSVGAYPTQLLYAMGASFATKKDGGRLSPASNPPQTTTSNLYAVYNT